MNNPTIINCSKCNEENAVYHLEWSAITCGNCKSEIQNPYEGLSEESTLSKLREQIKNSPYTENQLLMAIVRMGKNKKK